MTLEEVPQQSAQPVRLEGVSKTYDGDVPAVKELDLSVGRGEFLVLVGPSGCGKSTLLRMVAGLEEVTSGDIYIGDERVTDYTPKQRDIAMVFQDYALYPHMSVRDNLGFGLRLRKVPRPARNERVKTVASAIGLEQLLDRRPAALSGGQRQRVAMGRAMVREPSVFLMDEPLSNLDAKLRVAVRTELARLHARLRTTTLYVTHDQLEAMTLGDRVAVLRDGVLQQCDSPRRLYQNPTNIFVATFIGSPAMNLLIAEVRPDGLGIADAVLRPQGWDRLLDDGHDRVVLGVRPNQIEIVTDAADASGSHLAGRVEVVEDLGTEQHLSIVVSAPPMPEPTLALLGASGELNGNGASGSRAGERLLTVIAPATWDPRLGSNVHVGLDNARIHYFDPETGLALHAASNDVRRASRQGA